MNRIAIGYSTKDKVELTERTIEPLLQPDKFDLFWADGSSKEGQDFQAQTVIKCVEAGKGSSNSLCYSGIRGGSGAAIVFLLTQMLQSPNNYTHIGLVEADVLLASDWFEPTMALFEQGRAEDLRVGAVSARCYEDRILVQREGYAVMHNLGAGMIIFTREAARIVLDTYRVQWTTENRAIFNQLAGVDIGSYWAFRGTEHFLVADWRWDAILACHGLATLALTPSPVEMIGQPMPLADMGLTLARQRRVKEFDKPEVFERYRGKLRDIYCCNWEPSFSKYFLRDSQGFTTIFPHQIGMLGGSYDGDWLLKDAPGFGPFGWKANTSAEQAADPDGSIYQPALVVPIFGPCDILMGGGEHGAQVEVVDEQSGYDARPNLIPEGPNGEVMSIAVPGHIAYRTIRVTALTSGATFYGIRTREPQPAVGGWGGFDYSTLPPARLTSAKSEG